MKINDLSELYHYFDTLAEQDADSDTLFASSYLRGFIALVSAQYGDESQAISSELFEAVDVELIKAKAELNPQDSAVVNNYWLKLKTNLFV